MIYLVCLTCESALRVIGELDELDYLIGPSCEWYPERYPCWTDACKGKAGFHQRIDSDALRKLEVRDLNPQEAFLAINQMGMPDERDCSAAAVEALFKAFSVKHVAVKQIRGSHRCVIDHIEMNNGAKVYLAPGPEGAIVYRISKPHSYAQEVLHENEQAHAASSS